MPAIDAISEQLAQMISNLIKGNIKRAREYAINAMRSSPYSGMNICMQDAIENLAIEQAVKSGLLNSPSVFPGIGTFISFLLLGTENLLILEQNVRLVIILLVMNGFDPEDQGFEKLVVKIIGQAYDLTDIDDNVDSTIITKEYVTKVLPPKYLSKGFNRVVSRIFPTRNRVLKLMPVFGIFYASLEGYTMTVKAGQATVKYLKYL